MCDADIVEVKLNQPIKTEHECKADYRLILIWTCCLCSGSIFTTMEINHQGSRFTKQIYLKGHVCHLLKINKCIRKYHLLPFFLFIPCIRKHVLQQANQICLVNGELMRTAPPPVWASPPLAYTVDLACWLTQTVLFLLALLAQAELYY